MDVRRIGPLGDFGARSWERPELTGFNRLPMSATLPGRDVIDLNGTWSFTLRAAPDAVELGRLVGATDDWDEVEVPGCWTMQGYDRPQYTNVQMPFPGQPPSVPDDNPTGIYRHTIVIPGSWRDRRVVLHVAGAESVLYVHLDGVAVGMGKDSRLPQEFDLTPFVVAGTASELALTVVRWSDATYLEDQDHWYHAGLHRAVHLYSTPPIHIADVNVLADYDPASGSGEARIRVAVSGAEPVPEGCSVKVCLAETHVAAELSVPRQSDWLWTATSFLGSEVHLTMVLPGIEPWTAETPVLHALEVSLVDPDGQDLDSVSLRVGFRRVEVRGHELLVNGQPVLIKGVNRHDHDMRRGKAVTAASIEADILQMKRHNLNAVRTSHYPADTHLYDICDELGMYVVDEANVETHAFQRSLSKDQRWSTAIFERVMRMARRDVNHPSIIIWSLGNESGSSPTHEAAASWLRAWDPSRPVMYEGGLGERLLATGYADVAAVLAEPRPESDVIAPMYPSVPDLVRWATTTTPRQPLIMCEYCHAMGNSCGGLEEYWDAIRTHPGLQGGFLWDWVDQALVQTLSDGTERLAYGGDFGDGPNDGPFCMNGVVAADRTPHPALLELAKVSQPIRMRAVDAARGLVEVFNEHAFVGLGWLRAAWTLQVDGLDTAGGDLLVPDVGPGRAVTVRAPVPPVDLGPGERAHLTIVFETARELPWAPAGHVVAWEQFEMARHAGPAVAPGPVAPQQFNRLEPRLALWRAPIDNETFGTGHARRWEALGLRHPPADLMTTGSTESADGAVLVTHEVDLPAALGGVARVGVRLTLGPGIASVEWLGDGPHEGYSDRRASTRVGRFRVNVDDWPVRYVHPQASGNRTGVRWLRFLDPTGETMITIDHLDDLDVTVSRWTDEQVAEATHLEDLPRVDQCFVWLDARHRGVGSGACGPDTDRAHTIAPGPYRWSYRLR